MAVSTENFPATSNAPVYFENPSSQKEAPGTDYATALRSALEGQENKFDILREAKNQFREILDKTGRKENADVDEKLMALRVHLKILCVLEERHGVTQVPKALLIEILCDTGCLLAGEMDIDTYRKKAIAVKESLPVLKCVGTLMMGLAFVIACAGIGLAATPSGMVVAGGLTLGFGLMGASFFAGGYLLGKRRLTAKCMNELADAMENLDATTQRPHQI